MIKLLFPSAATLLALVAVATATTLANKVNLTLAGHPLALDSVVVNGQTYVSLAQLKAQMGDQGGASQVSATEGPMGAFLFNGVWRFRATAVAWNADRTCWEVTMELRNGTNKTRAAGGNGTSDYPGVAFSVATASGDVLKPQSGTDITIMNAMTSKDLPPGAGATTTIRFPGKIDDKPAKLIWEFTGKAGMPFVKNPSFRVDLTRTAP